MNRNTSKMVPVTASTKKKALIRRFDKEPLQGYVNPGEFLQAAGVELLTPSGSIISIPYLDVKTVVFVKEFEASGYSAKVFLTRPKMEGLWVRMTFRDHDVLEGILPNDLVLWERQGYSVTPPEPYSNNQKLFVPREALTSMSVLGVVGSPLTRAKKPKPSLRDQPTLFD